MLEKRVLIEAVENSLKTGEHFHVGTAELVRFLLSPGDEAISFLSLADKACDEGGRKKFAVLQTKRGVEVAEIGRFFNALEENQDRSYRELQEVIEYMKEQRSFGDHRAQAEVDEWGNGRNPEESPPGFRGLGQQHLGGGR